MADQIAKARLVPADGEVLIAPWARSCRLALGSFVPRRGHQWTIYADTLRAKTRMTRVGDQSPPRAVGMRRSLSPAAE